MVADWRFRRGGREPRVCALGSQGWWDRAGLVKQGGGRECWTGETGEGRVWRVVGLRAARARGLTGVLRCGRSPPSAMH